MADGSRTGAGSVNQDRIEALVREWQSAFCVVLDDMYKTDSLLLASSPQQVYTGGVKIAGDDETIAC